MPVQILSTDSCTNAESGYNNEQEKKYHNEILLDQNFIIDVFGKKSTFTRRSYSDAVVKEVIPVQWADGKYGIILHYTDNNGQDCYLPLRIYFNSNEKISNYLFQDKTTGQISVKPLNPPVNSPKVYSININNYYTSDTLLEALRNIVIKQIGTFNNDISDEGLETVLSIH